MPFNGWHVTCVLIMFKLCLTTEERFVEEHYAQVFDDIQRLLNQDDPIILDDINLVFDQLNDVLEIEKDGVVFPDELLQLLHKLGGRIELDDSFVTAVRENIAIFIFDTTLSNPIFGLAITRRDVDIFTDDTFKILDPTAHPDVVLTDISEMVVLLPGLVRQQPHRISFVVLRDFGAFNNDKDTITVASRVISVSIQNHTNFGRNEQTLIKAKVEVEYMDNYGCKYWIFLEDGTGYWSPGECWVFLDPSQLYICHCNSLPLEYIPRILVPEDMATLESTVIMPSTMSPQEQIQKVLDDIQQLLDNQTAPIFLEDINQAIDQVNGILQLQQDNLEYNALLESIDQLSVKVDLNGTHTEAVVRDNIAVLIADATPKTPVLGVALASRDTDTFTEDSFKFLSSINSSLLSLNVSEIVVSLPLSVIRYPRRISFVVYRDSRVFSYDHELYSVNSRVIGINIDDFELDDYEVVDVHLQPMLAVTNRKKKRDCAYWNMLEDGTGHWSKDGCMLIKSNDPWVLDTCRCHHLSYYVEVLIPNSAFIPKSNCVLRILSIIGSLLSILSLFIIALTAVLFGSWRKNFRHQIWLQLSVALLMISISHLTILFARYDEFSVSCMLIGMLLHFALVAAYCWMLIAGVKAFLELYLPSDKNLGCRTMLIASVFSWGIPILKVVLLSISDAFMEPFEDMSPISKFCKPASTSIWLTFFTPTAVLMIGSWVVYFFVIYKLDIAPSARNEDISERNRDTLSYARVGLGLVLLAGLPPWIFGLFAYNIVGAYLFACTATTQGFILFVFIICCDVPTRNLWLCKLRIRRRRDVTPLTRSGG